VFEALSRPTLIYRCLELCDRNQRKQTSSYLRTSIPKCLLVHERWVGGLWAIAFAFHYRCQTVTVCNPTLFCVDGKTARSDRQRLLSHDTYQFVVRSHSHHEATNELLTFSGTFFVGKRFQAIHSYSFLIDRTEKKKQDFALLGLCGAVTIVAGSPTNGNDG
jgi:hypothetical protein